MFFKHKPSQPEVHLCYIDGQYYVEQFIPVEVLSEYEVQATGMKIVHLQRKGSQHKRQFLCKNKDLKKKPVKGIILRNEYKRG